MCSDSVHAAERVAAESAGAGEGAARGDVAIRVADVAKYYRVYATPRDRLKQFIVPRLQRLIGRPPREYGRDFHALDGISFEIARGETVGIIGRNGSGKSTLLQMICGTLAPTRGEVGTRGRVAALLELGAGFDPEFTGRENVYMNATVLGLSREEIDARFDDILAFSEIGDFIDQPVKTYSSGMYVRLAFAVIAHVDADILVIDEALAVGDAFFVQKCMRFLRDFMKRGTVLFVSHDTAAVLNLCQRAIWLDGGKVVAEGEPKDVADAYLQAFFESNQGSGSAGRASAGTRQAEPAPRERRDMRQDLINASPYRNDLEIFEFDPSASGFGKGHATIEHVELTDADGQPLSWIVGGETVTLRIRARAQSGEPLTRPIIGFYVKDRLGQTLFGDNSFLTYRDDPVGTAPGQALNAAFTFRMPILPRGDYSISTAIADGTQDEHVQHHWIHDALFFKSHSSSQSHGLVGIPMHAISLEVDSPHEVQ
ncbi:ABC transporter ATP-binding protein [Modicisalibacter sp. MOD 31.J]|uniref:ABC transporter ATP-binding protein n=1 Tax=Modicisalibacter sp. MOD 31.J TaxID=2831897 RepID=UPI001CCED45A|nr:ABC transporter ATP-binding protein [Modicisalibacter sp. MOD 31.J]MBZ9573715.1 ABC transporter ATP-binding protein [Modicisalibacter sp. MOD 31.J]